MVEQYCIKVESELSKETINISSTTDALSSHLHSGYLAVTTDWVDHDWKLKSVTLDFKRFAMPHFGDSTCLFLRDILDD